VGAPAGGSRSDLFREKHIGEIDEEKKSQDLANTTQAMGIVSVLIATVTFASAFTLPGGYYQSATDGGVPGTPILAGSYAFSAFILADALAFIFSGLASFFLAIAGMPAIDLSVRYEYTSVSTVLLRVSGGSLMASFAFGLYLVLAPTAVHSIATIICFISSVALLCGNVETLKMLVAVNTARARLGLRGLAVWCDLAPAVGVPALFPFASLIAIFGVPAIIGKGKNTRVLIAELIFLSLFVILKAPSLIRLMVKRWKV